MQGREVLEQQIRWTVGDELQIKVKEDKWLARGCIGGPTNQGKPQYVAELIDQVSK